MPIRRAVVFAVVGALLLASCTSGDDDGTAAPDNSTPTTTQASADGGDAGTSTFTLAVPGGLGSVVSNWDPATMYDPSLPPLSQMYERLTRFNPATGEVEPELATSWSSEDGGATWTFVLRDDVAFHTGNPLTAEAVKSAIERTQELDAGAAYIWAAVESIDTPDEHTLVFNLSDPAPLDLIASSDYGAFIYDTEAAESGDLTEWFEAGGADAGTGPYTVSIWRPGEQVELALEAFPEYWGGWDGDHYEQVVYQRVTEPTTAAQLARSGEVSYIQSLPQELWETFEGDPDFQTPTAQSLSNMFLLFNTASGPLADPLVRQAVAYGIDYDGIIELEGSGYSRTPGIVPQGIIGHFDDLPMYTYDPDMARQLLEEAGVGEEGVDVTLTYNNSHADQQIAADYMRSTLADVGVNLETRGLEGSAVVALAQSENPEERQDLSFLYWEPDYPDPWNFFAGLFASADPPVWNWGYYDNPAFDANLEEAQFLLDDERAAKFREMQVQLHEDLPGLVLYTVGYRRVLDGEVGGYVDNPSYPHTVFVYDLQPG